jgi:hypothetical protein
LRESQIIARIPDLRKFFKLFLNLIQWLTKRRVLLTLRTVVIEHVT